MPASIANAAPTAVMPLSLSRSFVPAREYTMVENDYRNGESQRGRLTDTSRKRWRQAKRQAPTQLLELRNFFIAQDGPLRPFYFYDPWEMSPKFGTFPSGVVNASGTAVTWVSGDPFVTGGAWDGVLIMINGVEYEISTVISTTSLTLTSSAGTLSGAAYFVPPDPLPSAGRYTARFDGPWQQAAGMARLDCELVVVELA